jgi:signal transduction histidine kinase
VEGEESAVSPEAREQLFQILREAVRNALAHSGCERLALRLRITGEEAVGVVEDDGRGFDTGEARQEGTGGLDFMAERAALVGGTCRAGVPGAPPRAFASRSALFRPFCAPASF